MFVSRVSGGVSVTRRGVLHGLLVSAAAVALAPVVMASLPVRPPRPEDLTFDEMYHGRHLLGARTGAGGGQWQVTVDGRALHLMRRADGTYLSTMDHYQSYPTALDAARAAVEELGPSEQLRDTEAEGSPHHGVHA
ncbi:tyrosinase family oxidase copper chaperone [Streptomyces sp. NPDC096311]|uniref:tyrosinase family oxidase copper chaperone n=1 Tax=Streptomyces sp. NPDC096311 TaxID=3366083 RepID=UPI0038169159